MVKVKRFPRAVFLERYWDYRPGEHATFLGRTQSGKTTLAFELLERTASPDLPVVALVMKPKDSTPARWGRRIGLKRISSWPPPMWQQVDRPPGWLLWPRLGDIDHDDENLRRRFRAAMAGTYAQAAKRRGRPYIIFADEVVGLAQELKLHRELNALWMRGSSMHLGLWSAAQRPFNVPQHAFSQAVHIFMHRDTDRRNVDRYREIGGVDPNLIRAVIEQMEDHQFLYVRRRGYVMCVIDR